MSRGRIAIAGAVAQKPGAAGHAWQFLQYLLGFRRLGFEVLLLDSLRGDVAAEAAGCAWLARVLDPVGLGGAWTLDLGDGRSAGMRRDRALRFVADADLLINVMGFSTDEELLGAARRRVFLDTDPGFGQMWRDAGAGRRLRRSRRARHDRRADRRARLHDPRRRGLPGSRPRSRWSSSSGR